MNLKCILIGGAGFLGSHLAMQLIASNFEVSIFDIVKPQNLVRGATYIIGDYYLNGLSDAILEGQDIVFLLAYSAGPQKSMEQPQLCYEKDISCMIRLLDQMRTYGVNHLILFSSGGTIYGNHLEETLSEDMDNLPINHYGIMKLTQEKIMLMYNQLYGMQNVAFRFANPYGTGQRASSGTGAVTVFLNQIQNNKKIILWGNGDIERDYIYIADAIQMVVRFILKDNYQEPIPIYNIGTGQGTTLNQLISIVERALNKKAIVEYSEQREIDVKSNVLDISKIQNVIGHYNCVSLDQGIRKYIEQMQRISDYE